MAIKPYTHVFLDWTQSAIPPKTNAIPMQVSVSRYSASGTNTKAWSRGLFWGGGGMIVPLDMTFPSAHHSPSTVNRNARELVMGTVRLSSAKGGLSV